MEEVFRFTPSSSFFLKAFRLLSLNLLPLPVAVWKKKMKYEMKRCVEYTLCNYNGLSGNVFNRVLYCIEYRLWLCV